MIGFITNGMVCFSQTPTRTIPGTMISSLEDSDADKIAFATVFGSSEVGEYFGIFAKDS